MTNSSSRFIAFEGADGVGKSTQVAKLEQYLQEVGEEVIKVREPGGTDFGEAIRGILLDRKDLQFAAEAETLLFLASRVELHAQVIAPALARGAWVLSDRFHISTMVYQGIAGQLGFARAAQLCREVLGDRRPSLNLILTAPLERSLTRMQGDDRFESRPGFLPKVAAAFAGECGLGDDPIIRIDAEGSIEAIASRVQAAVMQVFNSDGEAQQKGRS